MEALAIIGARSGSKGVPDKNLRMICGYPLLAYSIKAARQAGLLALVSSDSEHYLDVAHQYGAMTLRRPDEISGDAATDHQFISHSIKWVELDLGLLPTLLVHLRPTTPLRDPAYIAKAIEHMRSHPEATALRSVHEMPESAWKTCEIEKHTGMLMPLCVRLDEALDFINDPRQVFSATHHPNGYVDILRTDFVRNSGLIHGGKVLAFITPRVTEVDSEEDFELLEWQVSKRPELVTRLFS